MTFVLDEDFSWFLEQFGKPQLAEDVTENLIDTYKGLLPNRLFEYWRTFGFCSFKDGLIWIVNPNDYKSLVYTWLKGTGILETDNFHVFARSGFGVLYLWGEKTGRSWSIEPLNGRIFNNGSYQKEILADNADDVIQSFFGIISPDTIDTKDSNTQNFIFEDAVSKFDPLKSNEMFTFEPAPFIGGERSLRTINKVNIFIQSEILASMGQREITDMKGLAKKTLG
ncbi:GAD-like domain-containing protein [Cellvibrio sp. QJXJ]|uniref:GAD-like domain-containing protein n=1 Tax=Cellvibrio sp. QJXJ TaxID=2964606 RepID=UPI0021C2D084|nr:GAD-like domain-containing protein [Cellvibrio sp. QJXJ]UUA71075.1 DUF1851 domain-containing protein [Cellvibrio sp. QJXJ]